MTSLCGKCRMRNTCSYEDMILHGKDCKTWWPVKGYVRGKAKGKA